MTTALAPLVMGLSGQESHSEATRLFLEAMKAAQPAQKTYWKRHEFTDYPLTKLDHDEFTSSLRDDARATEMLNELIPILLTNREAYPGWHLCPAKYRRAVFSVREEIFLLREPVEARLSPTARVRVVLELIWHHKIRNSPITDNLLNAAGRLLSDADIKLNLSERELILSTLLRHARWSDDESLFDKWDTSAEQNRLSQSESEAHILYQQCLRARERLDFVSLTERLSRISTEDPIWLLRRAALHSEVAEYAKATRLIKEALADLERRHRADRNSLWIKSCLAWANWLHDATQAWNTQRGASSIQIFYNLDISPRDEFEYFDNASTGLAEKLREEEVDIRPSFDSGVYSEGTKSKDYTFSEARKLLFEFESVIEHVGIPLRLNHVDICSGTALAIARVSHQPNFRWYALLLRTLHSHFDKAFEQYFSRIMIAQLSEDVAQSLILAVEKAIAFWVIRLAAAKSAEFDEDRRRCIDMLRLLIMALSRLTPRMTEEQAQSIFMQAGDWVDAPDLSHPWLLEALGELLKYTIQAMPAERIATLACEIIGLLISEERDLHERFLPDLTLDIWDVTPVRHPDDMRWNKAVSRLLELAVNGKPERAGAIKRLSYIAKRGVLTMEEEIAFGQAIWSERGGNPESLPTNTQLLFTSYAQLPAPNYVDVMSCIFASLSVITQALARGGFR